jgi:predicted ArsR family transcriptional regulator
MNGELAALAAKAYVYGFPLVRGMGEAAKFVREGMGGIAPAPFNSFGHAAELAGPEDRFVSVNNDTLYSVAQVDVSSGPVLLRVPEAAGRYYVLQFIDAWTNNFAYVGRRATGTSAGSFLLTPPDWKSGAPEGTSVIQFPTTVGTILGRWACSGPGDLAAVRALQDGLTLRPYGAQADARGIPLPAEVPDELAFFERMRTWTRAFPPSAADRAYQERFAPLGLLGAASPYADCPPELAKALTAGAESARQTIEDALSGPGLGAVAGGWKLNIHAFDYNLDHLGPGTIDDPAWRMPDRTASYLARALAARGGLWGNHGYEAAYPMTYADADGDQLDGRNRYTLTFDADPPVDAFWSVTMYDLPDFYLVANPIGRYSIGDRTPGLRRDADGALTIMIQHARPPDISNWLPAPAAPFRPILRLYQPRAPVLDGTYRLSPIRKAPPAGRDLRHAGVGKNLHGPADLRHTDVVKSTGPAEVPGAVARRSAGGAGNHASPGSAVASGSAVSERGTRGQVARLILELGPSTAATLGGRLGLTPAAIRRHLDNLLAEGLIETRTARTYGNRGRGRPAKLFVITDAGRGVFEHAYDDLATSALRFIDERMGQQAVTEFARRQISELERRYAPVVARGSLQTRVQALADALSADGYAASAGPAPVIGAAGGEQICQHHCPVAHVAAEFPQLCEAETEAFGRLLGTPVQRLATIAHGDGICTTHVTCTKARDRNGTGNDTTESGGLSL